MKKIEVLISPSQLDKVRTLLISMGIWELTVSEVIRSSGDDPLPPLSEASKSDDSELLKLELVTEEESVAKALGAIGSAIGRSRLNSSSVAILPVEQSTQIRSAEGGSVASRGGASAAA